MNGITDEAEELIHTANQITDDVKGKMKAIDPLIESVHDVGDMLHNVTSSVKRTALQKRHPKTFHTQERDSIQIKLSEKRPGQPASFLGWDTGADPFP